MLGTHTYASIVQNFRIQQLLSPPLPPISQMRQLEDQESCGSLRVMRWVKGREPRPHSPDLRFTLIPLHHHAVYFSSFLLLCQGRFRYCTVYSCLVWRTLTFFTSLSIFLRAEILIKKRDLSKSSQPGAQPRRISFLIKKSKVPHLIFRNAATPNTNNTTAMTVTVMAAMLPVKEEGHRKDEAGYSLQILLYRSQS